MTLKENWVSPVLNSEDWSYRTWWMELKWAPFHPVEPLWIFLKSSAKILLWSWDSHRLLHFVAPTASILDRMWRITLLPLCKTNRKQLRWVLYLGKVIRPVYRNIRRLSNAKSWRYCELLTAPIQINRLERIIIRWRPVRPSTNRRSCRVSLVRRMSMVQRVQWWNVKRLPMTIATRTVTLPSVPVALHSVLPDRHFPKGINRIKWKWMKIRRPWQRLPVGSLKLRVSRPSIVKMFSNLLVTVPVEEAEIIWIWSLLHPWSHRLFHLQQFHRLSPKWLSNWV